MQIDQLALRVKALFLQFAETECKLPGHQVSRDHAAIARKIFHPESSSFWEKISTTEEVCGMHQTQPEERLKVLLSTV
jgi:hypothetical protein